MNNKSMIKIVGIILTIMWVSQIPYLFPHPFQEHEGIKKLAIDSTKLPGWIKQQSQIEGKTADELEKGMMTELRIGWIKGALFTVIGVLSGWWLIQRKKKGYLLAFFFSLSIIVIKFIKLWPRLRKYSLSYFELLLRHFPVRGIHDILGDLVLLGTVIFLMYIFMTRKTSLEELNTLKEE
jgi:hypothetical protein